MSERVEIEESLRVVKGGMDDLLGRLESLSAALWQNIDHEDPAELESGVLFKQRFNERREDLESSLRQMLGLLSEHSESGPGGGVSQYPAGEPRELPAVTVTVARAVLVDSAAPAVVGTLDQKAPFGFILGGQTFTSASAWPLFYEALLQELYRRAPEKVSRLAEDPRALTLDGRPLFGRVPDRLDDPIPIADAIFAEADLEPEALLQVIRSLIGEMGYSLDAFKILLKEKNRGTVETLSIAA